MGCNICDVKMTTKIHTPVCVQIDTRIPTGKTNCADQNGGT